MSSDVVARVMALYDKALELSGKVHLVRAADYYGRAAKAARTLGADNLVMLHMQLEQVIMLNNFAIHAAAASSDPHIYVTHSSECIALLSGALEALERRRVAGTLLEGKCTAAEEAWDAARFRRINPRATAGVVASWAALFGYQLFLRAAAYALTVLGCALHFAAELSDAQFQSFAQHAMRAAELMQRHGA